MALVICMKKSERLVITHNESGEQIVIDLISCHHRRTESRVAITGDPATFKIHREREDLDAPQKNRQ